MSLLRRLRQIVQFRVEQLLLRSTASRLAVIALAMVLIALGAGLLVFVAAPAKTYPDAGSAVWWAFLRLTDSGYLGDDQGVLLRTVATVLTVLGVVLFVGALIATMTQWLNETIAKLEAGYTPIAQNDHILILGWNNRTGEMIEQLVESDGRVRRFLRARRIWSLRIVVLAERVTPALAAELKDRLGRGYSSRRITLRSGSALRADHLKRVDYRHAGAIMLPAREFDAEGVPDERTIKTLMSAATSSDEIEPADLPLVVAELFDADLLETARGAYPGPAEFIGTPQIIARLLAQNARLRGLSGVYNELLASIGDDQANQIFVRSAEDLAGERLDDLAACYDHAILLGVARDGDFSALYADPEQVVAEHDRLAFIARRYEHCAPDRSPQPAEAISHPIEAAVEEGRIARRVLVLGWNQKLVSLLAEFDRHSGEDATVDVFSLVPIAEREAILARRGLVLQHAVVNQVELDITSYTQLAGRDLASYDTVILVASDWLGSAEAADARLLSGYLVVRRALSAAGADPALIVETMAEDNAPLFAGGQAECLVSPVIQSSLLTQVALRRELHWVVEDMFGPKGAELAFRPVPRSVLGQPPASFAELAARCGAAGEILLGIMRITPGGRAARLNPPHKHEALELGREDQLIVLDGRAMAPGAATTGSALV